MKIVFIICHHQCAIMTHMEDKNKTTIRYISKLLILLILFTWALVNFNVVYEFLSKIFSLFSPFLIGCVIAFLINVILKPIEKLYEKAFKNNKLKRPICLILSTILVLGIMFAIVFMMIPSLQESSNEFIKNVPKYVKEIETWWTNTVSFAKKHNIVLPEYAIDTDKIVNKITSFINNEGNNLVTTTIGAASSIFSGLINALLALVFAIYLLAQKEIILNYVRKTIIVIFKDKAKRILEIASLTSQTFTSFVSGQLTEAVIIGVLCFIGMLILNIPYAAAVSVFVAATALIPVFGAWLGGGFGFLLILLQNPTKAIWFIIFLLILQQVEGNLIYPKVVGKSVGLPGILVLMAVTIGGEAFGIVGMLFSVPVCAILYSLYLEFMKKKGQEV